MMKKMKMLTKKTKVFSSLKITICLKMKWKPKVSSNIVKDVHQIGKLIWHLYARVFMTMKHKLKMKKATKLKKEANHP